MEARSLRRTKYILRIEHAKVNLVGLQSVVGHKNKTQIVSLARVVRINWSLVSKSRFKRGLDLIICLIKVQDWKEQLDYL
jgi:hypothetical protein